MKRITVWVAIALPLGCLLLYFGWMSYCRKIEIDSRHQLLRGVIEYGDSSIARDVLLAEPTIVDSFFEDGTNLLLLACQNKRHEIIQILLEQGANPNVRDKYGNTPLSFGASGGDCESVALLLKFHADPEQPSSDGFTPLHWASVTGSTKTVKLLIEHGANVDSKASGGTTPLLLCLQNASVDVSGICALLVNHGADPHAKNDLGITPVLVAKKKGINLLAPAAPDAAMVTP